jgi:hypothetical protein
MLGWSFDADANMEERGKHRQGFLVSICMLNRMRITRRNRTFASSEVDMTLLLLDILFHQGKKC